MVQNFNRQKVDLPPPTTQKKLPRSDFAVTTNTVSYLPINHITFLLFLKNYLFPIL